MKILSIGLSAPHDFKLLAEGIKFVEGTDFSHIFISWKDFDLTVRKVAEARGSGGKMISNVEFKRCNHVVRIYHFEVTDEQLKAVEKWLWLNLGSYGKLSILGLFLMRIGMLINKLLRFQLFKPKNIFKDGTHSQICCEVALNALKECGYEIEGDIEDYGLRETACLLKSIGKLVDQEKIDRINGNAS